MNIHQLVYAEGLGVGGNKGTEGWQNERMEGQRQEENGEEEGIKWR